MYKSGCFLFAHLANISRTASSMQTEFSCGNHMEAQADPVPTAESSRTKVIRIGCNCRKRNSRMQWNEIELNDGTRLVAVSRSVQISKS